MLQKTIVFLGHVQAVPMEKPGTKTELPDRSAQVEALLRSATCFRGTQPVDRLGFEYLVA